MLTALNRLMAEEDVDVGAALNGGSNAPSEHGDEDAGLPGPGSGRSSRLGSSEGGGDGQERDGNGAAPRASDALLRWLQAGRKRHSMAGGCWAEEEAECLDRRTQHVGRWVLA